MSVDLEDTASYFLLDRVPDDWLDLAYPNSKPLAGFINNLISRIEFLENWVYGGHPQVFWFSGLFYPQAFLTAVLQNYARKHEVDMESLVFDHKVLF